MREATRSVALLPKPSATPFVCLQNGRVTIKGGTLCQAVGPASARREAFNVYC